MEETTEDAEDTEDVELVTLIAVLFVVVVLIMLVTCTIMSGVRMCMRAPLVPVTRIVKFPGEALEPAVTVKIEVAVPPEAGVTGEPIDVIMFAGALPSQEAVNVTVELKPFIG
ncbi:MAG TPA: hypothetical protein VJZ03_09190 [Candidatus Bathyarchaeia archaeon]|nr:hypothetical protein [Candidatus Bathyarchaeia archaeon]